MSTQEEQTPAAASRELAPEPVRVKLSAEIKTALGSDDVGRWGWHETVRFGVVDSRHLGQCVAVHVGAMIEALFCTGNVPNAAELLQGFQATINDEIDELLATHATRDDDSGD